MIIDTLWSTPCKAVDLLQFAQREVDLWSDDHHSVSGFSMGSRTQANSAQPDTATDQWKFKIILYIFKSCIVNEYLVIMSKVQWMWVTDSNNASTSQSPNLPPPPAPLLPGSILIPQDEEEEKVPEEEEKDEQTETINSRDYFKNQTVHWKWI